ncbi:hypothetical protein [Arthrobacter rhombi]|uniref:hypothetical protein n=1 Tax=Arthrobacter rhombi TaxID=71253 RepID=UPI003FD388AF
MADTSNNPYAFPLPPCTAHTFQWEDGERDECYRCGATRPVAGRAPEGDKTAELRRRGLPTTATGLASEAKRHGMKPSALLRHCQTVGAL